MITQKQIDARDEYIKELENRLSMFGGSGSIYSKQAIENADKEEESQGRWIERSGGFNYEKFDNDTLWGRLMNEKETFDFEVLFMGFVTGLIIAFFICGYLFGHKLSTMSNYQKRVDILEVRVERIESGLDLEKMEVLK